MRTQFLFLLRFPRGTAVLKLLSLFVMAIALALFACHSFAAQFDNSPRTQSEAAALAEAARLNDEIIKLYQQGRYDKALPLAMRAVEIRERLLGSHSDTVQSLNNLGMVLQALGDPSSAIPYLVRALAIVEHLKGPAHPDTASSLSNLAGVVYKTGDLPGARRYLERALAIYEQTLPPDHPDLARTLNNLGGVLHKMGNLPGARVYYERALAINEKVLGPADPETAAALNNLGVLLRDMNDLEGAQRYMESALAAYEKAYGTDHPNTLDIVNNLADLLRTMGKLEDAAIYLKRVLTISEKRFPEHPMTAVTLNQLGLLHEQRGELAVAQDYYKRALVIREKVLGAEHFDTAVTLDNLAVVLEKMGYLKTARSYMERALAVFEKALGPNHPDTILGLNNLSGLLESIGEIDRAIALRERSLDAEEQILASILSIGTEQQQERYLRTLVGHSQAAVSLHLQTAPDNAHAARLALMTILRRKGRALDANLESRRLLRKHLDTKHQALFDRLSDLRAHKGHLLLQPAGLSTDERSARVVELDEKITALESALSIADIAFREMHAPVTLAAVQARIPAQTALVEFFVYWPALKKSSDSAERPDEPRYVAYVLRRSGEPRWVVLGRSGDIQVAVNAFRESIANRKADMLQRARALDALTMEKIRPLLDKSKTLLISPDGFLHLVPFAALVDEDGKYLIERYRISYLTCGRDLLREAAGSNPQEASILVGDPAFDGNFGTAADRGERESPPGLDNLEFGPLPGTRKEVRAIGQLLKLHKARVLIQEAATEAAVKSVKGPRILHLATHGFFVPDVVIQPSLELEKGQIHVRVLQHRLEDPFLRSGLALSGFNHRRKAKSANDGVLTALEVAGLNLWGTEVVALSACETGLGDVRTGEGVFGLRRALLLAGSKTQVMTLWQVADEPTKDLMIAWYGQLQQGVGRAEALHREQIAASRGESLPVTKKRLRARGVKPPELDRPIDHRLVGTRHPYYWASFILSGATGPISAGK